MGNQSPAGGLKFWLPLQWFFSGFSVTTVVPSFSPSLFYLPGKSLAEHVHWFLISARSFKVPKLWISPTHTKAEKEEKKNKIKIKSTWPWLSIVSLPSVQRGVGMMVFVHVTTSFRSQQGVTIETAAPSRPSNHLSIHLTIHPKPMYISTITTDSAATWSTCERENFTHVRLIVDGKSPPIIEAFPPPTVSAGPVTPDRTFHTHADRRMC